jgi:hypothetical protein
VRISLVLYHGKSRTTPKAYVIFILVCFVLGGVCSSRSLPSSGSIVPTSDLHPIRNGFYTLPEANASIRNALHKDGSLPYFLNWSEPYPENGDAQETTSYLSSNIAIIAFASVIIITGSIFHKRRGHIVIDDMSSN